MSRDTNPEFGRPLRQFFRDEAERAQLEAQNGLLQFDKIITLRIAWGGRLQFDEETVKLLHHAAIHGIYEGAGEFRDGYVGIEKSKHVPPKWKLVPELVAEMCDYANSHQGEEDAIHVSAYLLWRLNWIHPFFDGNGRTARAISYLALSTALNLEVPGTVTVVDQLIRSNDQYYSALEEADKAWTEEVINVRKMEDLITDLLIEQLESGT